MSEGSEKMKDLKEKTLKSLGLGYPKKVVNPRGGMFGERKVSKAKKLVQTRGELPTELVFQGVSRARDRISIPITGTPVVLTR